MKKMTPSSEDYLEMIYSLHLKKCAVRTTDIANELGVSKPSVNRAIKSLKEQGLATQEKYSDIIITKKGIEIAKGVLRRHNLIKSFLINILGVDKKAAEYEACGMEHFMSKETMQKLEVYISKILGREDG